MPQIIARATNTVRNKNIAMVVLCLVFLCWFAYDGFVSWPKQNDEKVAEILRRMDGPTPEIDPQHLQELQAWKTGGGWNAATSESRKQMDEIINGPPKLAEGWRSNLDLVMQRWIVLGLIGAVAGAIWWLIHCQHRRAIAEELFVSPARGANVPWDNIEIVDNTRWKSAGIVEITYVDANGIKKKAKFDDYETEREPLIQILDLIGEKALKAEFIPKEESHKEESPETGSEK
ncbi:MAG: hypothetical protein FWD61_18000 [Phycisphaerales bacterium]|nr:hypothetical protein [Phycisphaerales bacterium]